MPCSFSANAAVQPGKEKECVSILHLGEGGRASVGAVVAVGERAKVWVVVAGVVRQLLRHVVEQVLARVVMRSQVSVVNGAVGIVQIMVTFWNGEELKGAVLKERAEETPVA